MGAMPGALLAAITKASLPFERKRKVNTSENRETPDGESLEPQISPYESRPLWGGGSNDLFTGGEYQISFISDIFILIHNSSKVTVMK